VPNPDRKPTPSRLPQPEPLHHWRRRHTLISEISRLAQDGPSLTTLTAITVTAVPVTTHLAAAGFPTATSYQVLIAAAAICVTATINNLRHAATTRRRLRDTDLDTLTAVATYLRRQPIAARNSRRVTQALTEPDLIAVYGGTRPDDITPDNRQTTARILPA
jgi:hypothetical protein